MNISRLLGVLLLAGLTAANGNLGYAQGAAEKEKSAQQQKAKIDPKAEKIIQQVGEFYAGLKSFTVDLGMTMHMEMQGVKQEMPSEYNIAMRRPDRVAITLKSGMMGASMVSDGSKLYTYVPMLKRYTVTDAPKDLGAIAKEGGGGMANGMAGAGFLEALFSQQPKKAMLEGVKNGYYLGVEKVQTADTHHLKFSQNEGDWEIWIDAGQQPLVRKITLDLAKIMAAPGVQGEVPPGLQDMMKDMKMEVVLAFQNWGLNPSLPDDRFKFTPPAGAEKVESFVAASDEAEEEESELLGKPAPDFQVKLLEGDALKLSALKGQKVVILDFWATWCGPCVKALPILSEVAEEYKNKGVAFYAVNVEEDPATIRAFMKQKNFKFPVALDRDSKVSELFGVEGIPQTVIIDKNGVVQSVHVGYNPGLKNILKSELDRLLAGKSLVPAQK